jgi:hypothetical protein
VISLRKEKADTSTKWNTQEKKVSDNIKHLVDIENNEIFTFKVKQLIKFAGVTIGFNTKENIDNSFLFYEKIIKEENIEYSSLAKYLINVESSAKNVEHTERKYLLIKMYKFKKKYRGNY